MVKLWAFLNSQNWWRLFSVLLALYFGIASYTHGWLNSVVVIGFVWCLYNIGYNSALHDLIKQSGEQQ